MEKSPDLCQTEGFFRVRVNGGGLQPAAEVASDESAATTTASAATSTEATATSAAASSSSEGTAASAAASSSSEGTAATASASAASSEAREERGLRLNIRLTFFLQGIAPHLNRFVVIL